LYFDELSSGKLLGDESTICQVVRSFVTNIKESLRSLEDESMECKQSRSKEQQVSPEGLKKMREP